MCTSGTLIYDSYREEILMLVFGSKKKEGRKRDEKWNGYEEREFRERNLFSYSSKSNK
jgi:hypothetical protein